MREYSKQRKNWGIKKHSMSKGKSLESFDKFSVEGTPGLREDGD